MNSREREKKKAEEARLKEELEKREKRRREEEIRDIQAKHTQDKINQLKNTEIGKKVHYLSLLIRILSVYLSYFLLVTLVIYFCPIYNPSQFYSLISLSLSCLFIHLSYLDIFIIIQLFPLYLLFFLSINISLFFSFFPSICPSAVTVESFIVSECEDLILPKTCV